MVVKSRGSEETPAVRRDNAIRSGLLGVLVLAFVANLLTTTRPLILGERPVFVSGPELARAGQPGAFGTAIDAYGTHVMKLEHRPLAILLWHLIVPAEQEPEPAAQAVRYGYSGFESVFLGLPLWLSADMGPAIGFDGVREYSAVPLEYVDFHRIGVAEPSGSGLTLAKLGHLWGWLVIVALAGYGWFELKAAEHRREAAGIL